MQLTPYVCFLDDDESYVAYYTSAAFKKDDGYPFYMRRQILAAETLCDAVRGCDTYISGKLFPLSSSSV